jgi:predicted NBD/HSP70 family sugar kinase
VKPSRLRMTPGALFGLLRQHPDGLTKSEVVALTGLSRTAVSQRVDELVAAGYLTSRPLAEAPGGAAAIGRGRPAERYRVDLEQGVLLIADTGATGMRTAVCDPTGTVLRESYERLDVNDGPVVVLDLILDRLGEHLDGLGIPRSAALGLGLSVPGPVDGDSGRLVTPPVMTGWHDYDIPGHISTVFDCPTVVVNDANAMVYGEHRAVRPDVDDMVFIKVGTGVSAGLLMGGELQRGFGGGAGDIGHIPVNASSPDAPECRCGRLGCVEAWAGGWAVLRDLAQQGRSITTIDELVRAVRSGDRQAHERVRAGAEVLGVAISDLVTLLNPRLVVFGGQLSELGEVVLAAVREVVYRRSPPWVTQGLSVVVSGVNDAGVLGLAALVADHVFSPDRIDGLVLGPDDVLVAPR